MALLSALLLSPVDVFVDSAVNKMGVEYQWEGRMTRRLPHLDCLGLVYRAYEEATGTSWKKISVTPSVVIEKKQLGAEVGRWTWSRGSTMSAEAREELKRGDVLFLLWDWDIEDKVLGTLRDGTKLKCGHVVIYKGDGNIVHASPFDGKVVTEPLAEFLVEHDFLGVVAVRPFTEE